MTRLLVLLALLPPAVAQDAAGGLPAPDPSMLLPGLGGAGGLVGLVVAALWTWERLRRSEPVPTAASAEAQAAIAATMERRLATLDERIAVVQRRAAEHAATATAVAAIQADLRGLRDRLDTLAATAAGLTPRVQGLESELGRARDEIVDLRSDLGGQLDRIRASVDGVRESFMEAIQERAARTPAPRRG